MHLFSWDWIPDVNLQSTICLIVVAVSSCRSKLRLVCCQENGSIYSTQILDWILGCHCSLMCISLTLLEGMHTELGSAVIVRGPSRVLLGLWCAELPGCAAPPLMLSEPVEWVWQGREADLDLLILHKCRNSSSARPSKALCNFHSTTVVNVVISILWL